MTSFQELMVKLQTEISEVTVEEARTSLEKKSDLVLLDVREKEEWLASHIPGAVHLSRGYLELKIEQMVPDKTTEIICQCGGGTRSLLAAKTLKELGYHNVSSMAGGFRQWCEKGCPVEEG